MEASPTVKSPNPEDKAAFTLALGYAKEQGGGSGPGHRP